MSLFEEMGRKVEKFKQSATSAASDTGDADGPTHHCLDCEEQFDTDYERCPECDGDHVVAL